MKTKNPFWLLPLLATALYPLYIAHFIRAVASFRESGNVLIAAWAAALMLLAMSVPFLALRALMALRAVPAGNSTLIKGFLYVIFSVSPLFTLTVLLSREAGVAVAHDTIWMCAWAVLGLLLYFMNDSAPTPISGGMPVTRLRVIHGASAAILLAGFLLLHIANHVAALWSTDLHVAVMEATRSWYRLPAVEYSLFALLALMLVTGAPMVLHYARREIDVYRMLQIATGVYIAVFLSAHLLSVLRARGRGVETDWFFATGREGLLNGTSMLIPYYAYSILFFFIHIACGLRIVLLKHGVSHVRANTAVRFIACSGALLATVISLASLGFHLQG